MLMGAYLLEAGAGGWGGILLVAGLIAGLALGLIGAIVTWRKTARLDHHISHHKVIFTAYHFISFAQYIKSKQNPNPPN